MSELDAERFPRVAAYLAALPAGLDSYPHCRAKASLYRTLYLGKKRFTVERGLPPALTAMLDAPAPVSAWVPECCSNALLLAAADQLRLHDAGFLEWNYRVNAEVLSSPLYRLLMFVSSPALLLRGLQGRWGALHAGTTMSAVPSGPNQYVVRMGYPAGLWNEPLVLCIGEGARAAVLGSGAGECGCTLLSLDAQSAAFELRWR